MKNSFNNSEEVRENTNNSIKYIRKHANTLHLTLSNNMKYEEGSGRTGYEYYIGYDFLG